MIRRPGSVGVLGVVLIALSVPLLWPLLGGASRASSEPAVRVLLVDASASVVRTRPEWATWVRARLREVLAASAGEDVALVLFAEEVRRVYGPADAAGLVDWLDGRGRAPFHPQLDDWPDAESRLSAAIRANMALLDGATRPSGWLEILSDREFTGERPDALLRSLVQGGVGIRWWEPPPRELADVAVVGLDLPVHVEVGAPLAATARLQLTPGAGPAPRVDLHVEITSSAGARRIERENVLAHATGSAVVEVPLELGEARSGLTRVAVRARTRPRSDPVPENDLGRAACRAGEDLVVGVLGADEWTQPFLAAPTPTPGLSFTAVALDELAARAAELDAVVTVAVRNDELPARTLRGFVEAGGGWLRCAGWSFLRRTAPALDELSALLPSEDDSEERDVVLLLDGSGSMAGEPFEAVRAAALQLVLATRPSDELHLRFFTGRLLEDHLLRPRGVAVSGDDGAARLARELLALRVPRGSTRILTSLEDLVQERAGATRPGLVLLLTDGQESIGVLRQAERAAAIRDALDASRTELAPVAVGEEADLDFLGLLVREGEELYEARDLEHLEEIFQSRVQRERVRSGAALPVAWSAAGPWAREMRAGSASGPGLPPVMRHARAEVRAGGEAIWTAQGGEPVLGVMRFGRGRTATWVSLPGAEWAPAWRERGAAFAPILRWLARDARAAGPRAVWDGEWLTVEGSGADAPGPREASIVGRGDEELLRATLLPRASGGGLALPGALGVRLAGDARRRLDARAHEAGVVLLAGDPPRQAPLVSVLAAELRPGGCLRTGVPGAARQPRPPATDRAAPKSGPLLLAAGLVALFAGAASTRQGIRRLDR